MLRVEERQSALHRGQGHMDARMDANNREMSASEIGELRYQRGTQCHQRADRRGFAAARYARVATVFAGRGSLTGSFAEQLFKIGLAKGWAAKWFPLRAAVLAFAEEPGILLAVHDARADVRVMVYDGNQAVLTGATPNFRKPPKRCAARLSTDRRDGGTGAQRDYRASRCLAVVFVPNTPTRSGW